MLVSLIMPIYNSKLYLKAAIESVLAQSYNDFELLLIDDGSSDLSQSIAKEFESKDSRIKFFQNEYNLGICGTRNKGIVLSKGEYISFLDNDDELDGNFLLDNVRLLQKKNADAVKFGRVLVDISKTGDVLRRSETIFFNYKEELFTNKSKYDYYHFFKKNNLLLNVWNGIYKRKVIVENNLIFDESMKFGSEDANFSYDFFSVCGNIIINPNCYYIHYRRDLTSTSRKYHLNKISSILETAKTESLIWKQIDDECELNYIDDYKLQYIKIIISNQLLHKECDLTKKEKMAVIKQMINSETLKIADTSLAKRFTLDSILRFLIKRGNIGMILYMYSVYKLVGGEKWN